MVIEERLVWDQGTVSAAWHRADGEALLVLAHGAGGTMDTPSLHAYADAVALGGVDVIRFNLPYAEAGRRAPGPRVRDEACWRAVAAQVRGRARRLLLGGRSYGGRLASHVVAAGTPADGLVFLAYPLHPPGKPERLRVAHLARIPVPMLFLQGTRDPFAQYALLVQAIARLPGATLHSLDGGGHSHEVAGRDPRSVVAELADATHEWIARLS